MNASIYTYCAPPLSRPSLSVQVVPVLHLLRRSEYFQCERSNFDDRFAFGFCDERPPSWIAIYTARCWWDL